MPLQCKWASPQLPIQRSYFRCTDLYGKNGSDGGLRSHKPFGARLTVWCVYSFRHIRIFGRTRGNRTPISWFVAMYSIRWTMIPSEIGSHGWARTSDKVINSHLLVPTELRANLNGGHGETRTRDSSVQTRCDTTSPTAHKFHDTLPLKSVA